MLAPKVDSMENIIQTTDRKIVGSNFLGCRIKSFTSPMSLEKIRFLFASHRPFDCFRLHFLLPALFSAWSFIFFYRLYFTFSSHILFFIFRIYRLAAVSARFCTVGQRMSTVSTILIHWITSVRFFKILKFFRKQHDKRRIMTFAALRKAYFKSGTPHFVQRSSYRSFFVMQQAQ